MKNLRRLACKFDLNQSERKSSQVNTSTRKSWPNGVASTPKFSTCGYLRLSLARALFTGKDKQFQLEQKKQTNNFVFSTGTHNKDMQLPYRFACEFSLIL